MWLYAMEEQSKDSYKNFWSTFIEANLSNPDVIL